MLQPMRFANDLQARAYPMMLSGATYTELCVALGVSVKRASAITSAIFRKPRAAAAISEAGYGDLSVSASVAYRPREAHLKGIEHTAALLKGYTPEEVKLIVQEYMRLRMDQ